MACKPRHLFHRHESLKRIQDEPQVENARVAWSLIRRQLGVRGVFRHALRENTEFCVSVKVLSYSGHPPVLLY